MEDGCNLTDISQVSLRAVQTQISGSTLQSQFSNGKARPVPLPNRTLLANSKVPPVFPKLVKRSLQRIAEIVTKPRISLIIFVKRKLEERGYYDIRGLGEITTIREFKDRAFAIQDRSREQTLDDVARLRKKYEQPILGEVPVERLLELLAQIVDPTNFYLYCGSQLTHTLQVLESMEKAGITDQEFLATTLIHDLGKLAILNGESWENIEGGGKIPLGENVPGSGFANCTFNWDHADIVHARFKPYVSENMQWVLNWHSIQPPCEPLMDAKDRALFDKYYKPFVRHDRTFIFHHLPKKRLGDYLPLLKEFFPRPVLFSLFAMISLGVASVQKFVTPSLASVGI